MPYKQRSLRHLVMYFCFEVQERSGIMYWVTDGVNFQPVNYCPVCGAKAPMPLREPFDSEKLHSERVDNAFRWYNAIWASIPEDVEVSNDE